MNTVNDSLETNWKRVRDTKQRGPTGITCELNVRLHPSIEDMSVTKNNNKNSKGRQGLTVSHYSLFCYPTWLIWQCQWCEQILLSGRTHAEGIFKFDTLGNVFIIAFWERHDTFLSLAGLRRRDTANPSEHHQVTASAHFDTVYT